MRVAGGRLIGGRDHAIKAPMPSEPGGAFDEAASAGFPFPDVTLSRRLRFDDSLRCARNLRAQFNQHLLFSSIWHLPLAPGALVPMAHLQPRAGHRNCVVVFRCRAESHGGRVSAIS